MDEKGPPRPPKVPELGSDEARERIRRSGQPLDEWQAWPPSARQQAQVRAEARSTDLFVAILIAIVIGVVVLTAIFTGSDAPAEGDVCHDDRGAYVC